MAVDDLKRGEELVLELTPAFAEAALAAERADQFWCAILISITAMAKCSMEWREVENIDELLLGAAHVGLGHEEWG